MKYLGIHLRQRFLRVGMLRLWGRAALVLCASSCRQDSGDEIFDGASYPHGDEVREKEPSASREIVIGDRLEVFVEEDTTFNGIYPVRENGDIIVSRLGRIKVVGMSPKAAESQIKKTLEGGQLLKATVIVDRLVSTKRPDEPMVDAVSIYLTGKVVNAGLHRIPRNKGKPVGAYEALLISGGMARFADERKVHILRAGEDRIRRKIPVDIRAIGDGTAPDFPISEGDIIVVPERVFGF